MEQTTSKTVEVTMEQAPASKHRAKVRENILLILSDAATGRVEKVVEAHNIVTNEGNRYYAQRSAGETPVQTFQTFGGATRSKLAVAKSYRRTEPSSGGTRTWGDFVFSVGGVKDFTGAKTVDATYPRTSDPDTDNTGAGTTIVTWRRSYTTAQANFTIRALGIARIGATTTATATLRQLLNYVTLLASQYIQKTSSQTLKAFVNHTFLGV